MKNTLLISSDHRLSKEIIVGDICFTHRDQTIRHDRFRDALESLGDVHEIHETLWLVITERTPEEVRDTIKSKIEVGPEIFVIKFSSVAVLADPATCTLLEGLSGAQNTESLIPPIPVSLASQQTQRDFSSKPSSRPPRDFIQPTLIRRCRLCGGIAMFGADVCYTCNPE